MRAYKGKTMIIIPNEKYDLKVINFINENSFMETK
jgi:hypothetical protein